MKVNSLLIHFRKYFKQNHYYLESDWLTARGSQLDDMKNINFLNKKCEIAILNLS